MIISDRGSQFVARFWEQQHVSPRTHLIHSSAYHPQTDGQTKRVCVMEHQGSWDKNLPWVKFSYKNSNQSSLKTALLKVLYGRRCRTPLNWTEPGEKMIFGPNLIVEAEVTISLIQDNLKVVKSCQESCANKRR
jgi:hypothetical protein